jgi:hypothetical protein
VGAVAVQSVTHWLVEVFKNLGKLQEVQSIFEPEQVLQLKSQY